MRRNEIDAGSQPVRNLFSNPAFETTGGETTLRTNYFTNPSMAVSSSSPITMRTNLITNPSMEASSGNVVVRSNLAPNPGMEASSGLTNVRTNLTPSPRGVSALNPYNGTGTLTPNVAITGHPEGLTTALRVSYTTQSNPGVSLLDVAEGSTQYTISAWVYHESFMATPGTCAFAQAGITQGTSGTMTAGVWQKIVWTYTTGASNTANFGFRVTGNSGTGNGSFLITGMMVEKAAVVGPFFDGSTTTLNKAWNPSFETDFSSWGNQWYGNGGGAGTCGRVAGIGISGGAAARKTWTTGNTTASLDVGISTTIPVVPGSTYTASIYQRSSFNSYLTCYVHWKDASSAVISTSSRLNNVATPGNAWVRGYTTEVAPAGAVYGTFVFGPYTNSSTIPTGGTIDWDWCLIEETDKLNPYYDGTTAAPADFTYAWTGVANNSTSIQRAPNSTSYNTNTTSAKVWQHQSSTMTHTGSKSLVVESVSSTGYSNGMNFGIANLPIGSYVFSAYIFLPAAYGTSGIAACSFGSGTSVLRGNNITTTGSWQRTSVKFTVSTLGTTYLYLITDGASSVPVGARFYADSVMIEADNDISPYFDAANPRTNLIPNPSFEVNTTGWGGAGAPVGVISRDFTPVFTGNASLKVVCDGTQMSQGAFTSVKIPVKPNRYYTASVWVRADAGKQVRLELGEWDEGSNIIGSRTSGGNVTGTGDWVRVTATRLMSQNANSVDLVVRNSNAVAHTFWIDAAMLEEGDVVNDYYEGTGPFTYAWAGTANASASEQRAPGVTGITWQSAIAPYQSTAIKPFTGTKCLYMEGSASDLVYEVHAGPTVSGLTIGLSYTLSAWVFIMPGSVGLELQPSGVGSATSGRTVTSGQWERVYQTFVAASTSHMLRLRTIGNGRLSAYVDAMVLEQGIALLPYFDGTTPAYENIAGTTVPQQASITTGVSFSGTLWSRATAVTGSGSQIVRNIIPLSKLVDNQPYTVSVTIANDHATNPVYVSLDWCDGPSSGWTLAPGEIRRVSVTWTRQYYDPTYRFADLSVSQNATEQKTVLFKDWLIERGTAVNNYYAGTGDYSYVWGGTTDASLSIQRFYPVSGQVSSKSGSDLNTRFFGLTSTDETGAKTAKWISPAGTPNSGWRVASIQAMDYANIQSGKSYTLYIRYRASGWPSANTTAVVQFSDGGNNNQVMPPDATNRLNLQVAGWQTYRRTFTAALTANSATVLYLSLPVTPDPVTDGILEISQVMLVDNSYSGAYFDGSTVSTDADISYAWNGTANSSTSKMVGTGVNSVTSNIAYGTGVSSSVWKSSGAKSLRIFAKNVANNDSFIEINGMVNASAIKPNTKYTLAGTRYIAAPLTGTISGTPGFRVSIGGERPITYKPGYAINNSVAGASRVVANFTTVSGTTMGFIRLMNGSMEGNGDVWWDDIMLVEGDYDGRHIDGTKLNSKWDGTAHASTSVGYPTSLESLVGMPVFTAGSTPNLYALDSSLISDTTPRTFYSVVDAVVDLPNAMVDGFWTYGQANLSDTPANKTITFRYQSENGTTSNSVLARRTGGAGALKTGVPAPGRYILFCGLDGSGFIFAGHGGSPVVVMDNLAMAVPHEAFRVEANNGYHTHVMTYIYKGLHDAATRAEVIRLLAQRHNVPLLVA